MYPVLFKIGSLTFYSHGILLVAGIVFGALLVYFLSKKSELDNMYILDDIIYISLFGVIGARIAYFVLYPHQFTNISQIILLWQGGLVSYGGFILGAVVLLVLLKFQKQPILPWLDLFAIGLPLGVAFGRIGDWLAGDYGLFPGIGGSGLMGRLTNSPLLEAGLCVLIVLVLLSIYIFAKNKVMDGIILMLSVLIYSGGRFIIDFWRGDASFFLGLSLGQLFSLIVFVATLAIFVFVQWRRKKGDNYEFVS